MVSRKRLENEAEERGQRLNLLVREIMHLRTCIHMSSRETYRRLAYSIKPLWQLQNCTARTLMRYARVVNAPYMHNVFICPLAQEGVFSRSGRQTSTSGQASEPVGGSAAGIVTAIYDAIDAKRNAPKKIQPTFDVLAGFQSVKLEKLQVSACMLCRCVRLRMLCYGQEHAVPQVKLLTFLHEQNRSAPHCAAYVELSKLCTPIW
jgi:hypothetical protein